MTTYPLDALRAQAQFDAEFTLRDALDGLYFGPHADCSGN